MIDEAFLKGAYDEDTLIEIKNAFRTLNLFNVFTGQIEANTRRILTSFADQSLSDLASEIQEVRRDNIKLLALQALGER